MNRVLLAIGGVALGLVVGAALLLNRGGETASSGPRAFLPELKSNTSAITRIEIAQGSDSIAVERAGDAWTLASHGGYPAKIDPIRAVVSGLVGLEIDEPLTAKRERHGELGLAWPDSESKATLIRILDSQSQPLEELVLGEERFSPSSRYVRRLSDDQTYRCRGAVTARPDLRTFVETEIVSLPAAEIQSINYGGLVLTRGEAGTWTTELAATPVDDSVWPEAQRTSASQTLPGWIARLDFEDVRPRERPDATWSTEPTYDLTYFAERATISIEGRKEGESVWLRVAIQPSAESATEPPPEQQAESDANDAPKPVDWAAWNTRLAAWEFRLPAWKSTALERIRETPPASLAPPPAATPSTAP